MREGKNKDSILLYASQWDSEAMAARYFEAYQRVLQRKWKRCEQAVINDRLYAGTGDDGRFVVRLSRDVVSSIEGIPDEERWRLLIAEAGQADGPNER